jgi:hypothetical protein
MPRLRGHHLICLHFFNGEGYNPEFVENLMDVMEETKSGDVEISPGADDICEGCPHLKQFRCRYTEDADEGIREMDKRALELLKVREGSKVKWQEIQKRIPELFHSWYRAYCTTCGWKWACERDASYRQLRDSLK